VDQLVRYQKLRGKQGTKDLHVEQTNTFQKGVERRGKEEKQGKSKK
jgi:hypothetical protein